MGPPFSLQIPRVCRYSGYRSLSSDFVYKTITSYGWASQLIRLSSKMLSPVLTPSVLLLLVWPLSLSLATTHEISFWFLFLSLLRCFSSGGSPHIPMYSVYDIRFFTVCVSTFRNLRIDTYLQFPAAYRSLSRLSSAPDAKAFSLCSCLLELLLLQYILSYIPRSLRSLFKNCWVTFNSFWFLTSRHLFTITCASILAKLYFYP